MFLLHSVWLPSAPLLLSLSHNPFVLFSPSNPLCNLNMLRIWKSIQMSFFKISPWTYPLHRPPTVVREYNSSIAPMRAQPGWQVRESGHDGGQVVKCEGVVTEWKELPYLLVSVLTLSLALRSKRLTWRVWNRKPGHFQGSAKGEGKNVKISLVSGSIFSMTCLQILLPSPKRFDFLVWCWKLILFSRGM